jgi:hypothetical protein
MKVPKWHEFRSRPFGVVAKQKYLRCDSTRIFSILTLAVRTTLGAVALRLTIREALGGRCAEHLGEGASGGGTGEVTCGLARGGVGTPAPNVSLQFRRRSSPGCRAAGGGGRRNSHEFRYVEPDGDLLLNHSFEDTTHGDRSNKEDAGHRFRPAWFQRGSQGRQYFR